MRAGVPDAAPLTVSGMEVVGGETVFGGERLQQSPEFVPHPVMQRPQPAKLVSGGAEAFLDSLLGFQLHLFGAHHSLMMQLLSLTAHLAEHPLALIGGRVGLFTDLTVPLIELHRTCGRLLGQSLGAVDKRLLNLLPVRSGGVTGPFQQRCRLTGGVRAHLARFLLRAAQQLLHPIPKTLAAVVVLFSQPLQLAAGGMKLIFRPLRSAMLTLTGALQLHNLRGQRLPLTQQLLKPVGHRLVSLVQLAKLNSQGPNMVVNLLTVITTPGEIEHVRPGQIKLGRIGR